MNTDAIALQNVELKKFKISQTQYTDRSKIVYFGEDNLTPNQMNELFTESQTLQSCVNQYTSAIIGETDVPAWLTPAIKDYYVFGGFYLKVLRNLEGEIISVKPISFDTVRLVAPDDTGMPHHFEVGDWYQNVQSKKRKVVKYPVFEIPLEDAYEAYGHTASIYYYYDPTFSFYPTSRFQSVLKDIANEGLIQTDRYYNLQNGTSDLLFIKANVQTEEEAMQLKSVFSECQGVTSAKTYVMTTTLASTGDGMVDGLQIQKVESNRDFLDDNFEGRISTNICKAGSIPQALVGNTTSNMFSGEMIEQSLNYLIWLTKKDRKLFTKVLADMQVDLVLEDPTVISFSEPTVKITKTDDTIKETEE